jgi:hypothetical protein
MRTAASSAEDPAYAPRSAAVERAGRNKWRALPQRRPRHNSAKAGDAAGVSVPISVPVWVTARTGVGEAADFSGEIWSEWQDLNLRPPRPERGALPGCATLRYLAKARLYSLGPPPPAVLATSAIRPAWTIASTSLPSIPDSFPDRSRRA